MPNRTLKNVPKDLYARLKASAERNRRSLNSEILARLRRQFAAPVVDREAHARTLRDVVASQPRADHAKVTRYKRPGRA